MKWRLPNIKPYPVQLEARRRAKGRKGFMQHMEMGLGKTYEDLDETIEMMDDKQIEANVVLCPDSLKETWADAIEAAGIAHRGQIVVSPKVPTVFNTFWMVNYEAIRYDSIWEPLYGLVRQGGVKLTADESPRIKNFNVDTTKRALTLKTEATFTRALTGLAMVKDVMDWWPQLRFCGELQGVNPYAFRARYAKRGGYMGRQVVGIREEHAAELQGIIDRASFRALKKDWLDLPEKNYAVRHVKMTPPQEKMYKQMADDMLLLLESGIMVEANMVISQLLKLQQITAGFIMDNEGHARVLVPPESNPRIREVVDIAESVPGKVLIFANYLHSMRMVYDELRKRWRGQMIQGGMGNAAVREAVGLFNTDPGVKFMVAQTDTGGIGHTMLGSVGEDTRCATTVVYENNFRYGSRAQLEDRNHRIGQDQMVTYFDFISSKIDRHVIGALQKRRDLIHYLIDRKGELK